MTAVVYFRKNYETTPLFIKTNEIFTFHRNATIDNAGMDVFFH